MTPLDQFQINETEKLIASETEKGENSIILIKPSAEVTNYFRNKGFKVNNQTIYTIIEW